MLNGSVPEAIAELERDGCTVLRGVLTDAEIRELRTEIDGVFDAVPPERVRDDKDEFRYEMLNRSAACQRAIAHARILEVIEPLLGEDCMCRQTACATRRSSRGATGIRRGAAHPRPEDVPLAHASNIPCS